LTVSAIAFRDSQSRGSALNQLPYQVLWQSKKFTDVILAASRSTLHMHKCFLALIYMTVAS